MYVRTRFVEQHGFRRFLIQFLLYPPDILSPILCHAHVSPGLVDVVHRACGEPSPAVVVGAWQGHIRGMASGVAPPTARLGHPGDVHFDPLKPISFIQ